MPSCFHHRISSRPLLCLPLLTSMLLALSCSGSFEGTSVELQLVYPEDMGLERVRLSMPGNESERALGSKWRILLPDELAQTSVRISADGLIGDTVHARGQVVVVPRRDASISAQIVLAQVPCGDWCDPGSTRCIEGVVFSCVQDSQDCTQWEEEERCSSGQSCSLGECRDECIDECAQGETLCEGPGRLARCGQADADPCLDWQTAEECPSDTLCSAGACRETCTDECIEGESQCLSGGVSVCADLNFDGCTEFGPPVSCGAGQSCSGGSCQSQCSDECSQSSCNGLNFSECGQFDADPCLDLSSGVSCAPLDSCRIGQCTALGCESAPIVCNSPPADACIDANTLQTFSSTGTCSSGGGGQCSYSSEEITCANGCDAASAECIVITSCEGGCNSPPADFCLSETTLRAFDPFSAGQCVNDSCEYPFEDVVCQEGCSGNACNAPPPCQSDNDCEEGETCCTGIGVCAVESGLPIPICDILGG